MAARGTAKDLRPGGKGRASGKGTVAATRAKAGTAGAKRAGKRAPQLARDRPAVRRSTGRAAMLARGLSSRSTRKLRAASIAALEKAARGAAALTEEQRIESAKYTTPRTTRRVFEEERFLFPESYALNRIRLHVQNAEWLFCHWDLNPESLASLRGELGERAMVLSRLTLRVVDTADSGARVILLPEGARSWYLRAAGGQRAYRAELGVTLPSGEFRKLAESNVAQAPRVGPSPEPARERRTYQQARAVSAAGAAAAHARHAADATAREPWGAPPQDGAGVARPVSSVEGRPRVPGGASDTFRR